jgi:hypothetical protein
MKIGTKLIEMQHLPRMMKKLLLAPQKLKHSFEGVLEIGA